MARKSNVFPSYLLHQPAGQARFRIKGQDYYPGPFGSDESRIRYGELIANLAGGIQIDPIDGIGSARQLDRLCQRDARYRWICGGVSVNYHTLSDFRSQQAEFLEKVLVDSVAELMHQRPVYIAEVPKKASASVWPLNFCRSLAGWMPGRYAIRHGGCRSAEWNES